jgi:hypothetical protein
MMQRVEFIDPNNADGIATGSLVYGRAIVPAASFNGRMGWVLPGCNFTENQKKAESAAMEIDRLIRLAGGL